MAAVQDCLKVIADLQAVAIDIVAVAKNGNVFERLSGVLKAVQDAAPMVADIAVLAPEIKDLSQASPADYQALSHAALDLVFEVAKAAVA